MIKRTRRSVETVRQKFNKGLSTYKNFFNLEEGQSPSCINVKFNNDASISKRLGSSTMNTIALESTAGYGMYEFGVLNPVGGLDVNTKLLLHCNGVDGSTVFTDSETTPKTVTVGGFDSYTKTASHFDGANNQTSYTDPIAGAYTFVSGSKLSTAQFKFGTASLLLNGTSDYVLLPDSVDWDFGTGNFTIDFWVRFNSVSQINGIMSQYVDGQNFWGINWNNAENTLQLYNYTISANYGCTVSWTPSVNTWYHVAFVYDGSAAYKVFIDGVSQTIIYNYGVGGWTTLASYLYIGFYVDNARYLNGWLDEVRISKGIARWTTNFTPPTKSYSPIQIDTVQSKFGGASGLFNQGYLTIPASSDFPSGRKDFTLDEWLMFKSTTASQTIMGQGVTANDNWVVRWNSAGVNTANCFTFQSYSAGALVVNVSGLYAPATSTFLHLEVARQSTSNFYIFVNGSNIASTGTTAGLISGSGSLFKIGVNVVNTSDTYYEGWMDEIRVSNTTRHNSNFTLPTAEYYSAILQQRRLICASGTGIYNSEDIGKTWAVIQTNRTAAINYFSFVKDYVINTNDTYDVPQYWAGSSTIYFANISTAAPACKHSLSYQGFAIFLNESSKKTSMYYVDQNEMFSKAYSYFSLPTDRNDELTGGFSLGRNLYVSSKYKIFRLNYIGGSPDWEYIEVRGFGFVPKTIKKISLPNAGEAIIGLDWTKKLRVFLGSEEEIISDSIQEDNGITPFFLNNINSIELNKCWAENDRAKGIYKLFLVYGGSSTISHCLNFNYRTGTLYPDNGRPFNSGVLAADTADNLYMLGCNYNGRIHCMDSGNTDGNVPVDDHYVSSFFYNQSPSRVHKGQQIDLFFSESSSGELYLEDRTNFKNEWVERKRITLDKSGSSQQIRHTIDIPETQNVYQLKLSSSANTAEPWQLNLIDLNNTDIGQGVD